MALAGCSTQSELRFTSLMSEVPPARALILPPPGGPAIVAVLQRTYQNGISQEIALSTSSNTSGQNAFYVRMVNDLQALTEVDDTLTIRRITQERILGEMEERFPGVEMQTSLIYVQNKYGPFGFAIGRTGTDVCIYAWQDIEPNKPAILTPGGIISVRLRLCDADATEQQLLRTMYGFTISAYYSSVGWNPYGDAPSVSPQLGQMDAPLYPFGMGAMGTGAISAERHEPSAIRSTPRAATGRIVTKDTVIAPAPATRTPQVEQTPLSGYPVVPPPP